MNDRLKNRVERKKAYTQTEKVTYFYKQLLIR